jgi:hypothetical protein
MQGDPIDNQKQHFRHQVFGAQADRTIPFTATLVSVCVCASSTIQSINSAAPE